MKIYVGITDPNWYTYLSLHGITDEVNFWRPRGWIKNVRAIAPGELFFFRLGGGIGRIAGFGIFKHHTVLPLEMAWDTFGDKNGCATRSELVTLIARRRDETPDLFSALSWQVGCTILTNVHYYAESDWLPYAFLQGVQTGKSMDVATADGARIWTHMQSTLQRDEMLARVGSSSHFSLVAEERAIYTTAQVKERRAQGAFRVMVLDAYGRRCSITGERTLPVVEAAHIQTYVSEDSNHIQNGIALREDVHTLFDKGYVGVDEDYRFIVSPRLKAEYENGKEYYRFHGQPIRLPDKRGLAPSKEAIRWHLEHVYAG